MIPQDRKFSFVLHPGYTSGGKGPSSIVICGSLAAPAHTGFVANHSESINANAQKIHTDPMMAPALFIIPLGCRPRISYAGPRYHRVCFERHQGDRDITPI